MTVCNESSVNVGRSELIRLLCIRLQHRWLDGPSEVQQLTSGLFGRHRLVESELTASIVQAHRDGKLKSTDDLRTWLLRNKILRKFFRQSKTISLRRSFVDNVSLERQNFRWAVPQIRNTVELADFLMLGSWRVLDWLTLPGRRRDTDVTHYQCRSIRKRDGTLRWIESPRPILKQTQRIIASKILQQIPLHDAAIGFRRGYSIQDCARQHVGRESVLRMDLQDFFGSIHFGRVVALFRIAGYPSVVARTLAMICTASGNHGGTAGMPLMNSHLPQGAPTSPSLANAIAFRMDRRLAGLAIATGAIYTRYADDLIFSFDSRSVAYGKRFATSIAAIAMEEAFQINHRKTRFMRRGNRQRVLGMTVNEKLNVPRKDYENLKAILHNCVRDGLHEQNRDGHPDFRMHLRGRIAHVAGINPRRGAKLLAIYEGIL